MSERLTEEELDFMRRKAHRDDLPPSYVIRLLDESARLREEVARLRKSLTWALGTMRKPTRTRTNGDHCDAYDAAERLLAAPPREGGET